ncbi:sensor domain-containing diguanylate cyclase [Baaleninema simplex]|uniref:sensor domain-containing diguanylate cyclase n=1 Tax=Baaleninema simplex TaxID=2862350 RepID=UPI000348BA9F|nr:sensor domain-containing diguanylate cyclase [Baaleninema simplex]
MATDKHSNVCRSIESERVGGQSHPLSTWSQKTFSPDDIALEHALEHLPVGIAITNAIGQIVQANAAVAHLLDFPLDDLLETSIDDIGREIVRPDGTPFPREELPTAIARREVRPVTDGAIGLISEKGHLRWLAVTATPRPPSQGGGLTVTLTQIPPPFTPASEVVVPTDSTGETFSEPNLNDKRLEQILDCFLGFSSCPQENIRRLVELARDQLDATCACYQSLSRNASLSCTSSTSSCDRRSCCSDNNRVTDPLLPQDLVTRCGRDRSEEEAALTRVAICQPAEPLQKPFVATDGAAHRNPILGHLCVTYRPHRQPRPDDSRLLHTIATAIAVEEDRLRVAETLHQQTERELVVARLANRIQHSIELPEILDSATESLRRFLDADRTIVCRFNSDGSGEVLGESLGDGISSMLGWKLNRPWIIEERSHQQYFSGQVMVIDDIYTADLEPEALQLLEFFEIRARLVMPIAIEPERDLEVESGTPNVWGLLVAHQCHEARSWQPSQVRLLPQLATQLAIAIQQAQLYTRLKTANRELSELATRDGLTQVANRRRFDEYIAEEWKRLAREKSPLSLILLDIDFFKDYNDCYGHQAGDECLKRVAQALATTSRRPADLVARYGGEEFAIVLPNTDEAGAVYVAGMVRSILRRLHLPHERSPVQPFVTVSMGLATRVPFPEATPELLVAAADLALYRAKQKGRDRYCIEKGRAPHSDEV